MIMLTRSSERILNPLRYTDVNSIEGSSWNLSNVTDYGSEGFKGALN